MPWGQLSLTKDLGKLSSTARVSSHSAIVAKGHGHFSCFRELRAGSPIAFVTRASSTVLPRCDAAFLPPSTVLFLVRRQKAQLWEVASKATV